MVSVRQKSHGRFGCAAIAWSLVSVGCPWVLGDSEVGQYLPLAGTARLVQRHGDSAEFPWDVCEIGPGSVMNVAVGETGLEFAGGQIILVMPNATEAGVVFSYDTGRGPLNVAAGKADWIAELESVEFDQVSGLIELAGDLFLPNGPDGREPAGALAIRGRLELPGAAQAPARANRNNEIAAAGDGIGPDVIVAELQSVNTYQQVDGISAYAVGTTSCNLGDVPIGWVASTADHPVISQSIYRLKSGRFEHIGVGWLKHGFSALAQDLCGDCISPGTNQLLGVMCSDPYSASLNGQQSFLSMRSEVNPHNGSFPFPPAGNPEWSGTVARRIQIDNADVDPAQNAGALYFAEGHYVSADDALAGNGNNNASYRRLLFVANNGLFVASPHMTTQRELPAIRAWKQNDPTVVEQEIQVPDDGLFLLSGKASDTGTGLWEYEYAVYNLNSDRAGGWFRVPLPLGAVVTDVGFHDVNYHSGEVWDSTDWTWEVTDSSITWTTVNYFDNPNGNAIRWGTLYNFRFKVNVEPSATSVTLGLFKPGLPTSLQTELIGPTLAIIDCNNNGIADSTDIAEGTSVDCEPNDVPDECEPDCNENGVADPCDLSSGTSADCNLNSVPDECEPDCDGDGIPDDCEPIPDADFDGVDDCFDACPDNTPPGWCLCPDVGECCFDTGFCLPDFPRDFCFELGGTPECVSPPCRDGCMIGDANSDGDLDLADVGGLQNCFSGDSTQPGYVPPSDTCRLAYDFDDDGDVDLADFLAYADLLVESGP